MPDSAGRERRRRRGFGSVLHGEFAIVWIASTQSTLGDQLSRVALSILVFDRTGSGFATAVVYAVTFMPELVGSVFFGHLADRLPRRGLLVAGDIARAVLLAVMALPGMPIWLLSTLLAVAVLIAGPWRAAERALVADLLEDEQYVLGVGLRTATTQAMQIIGFAVGGLVVAAIGARSGLLADAATFAISALLLQLFLRPRPAAAQAPPTPRTDTTTAETTPRRRPQWYDGAAAVWSDRVLRTLLLYSWVIGLLIVPEGLAAPYAAQTGAGAGAVGVLLAALPVGVLVGSVWFARFTGPQRRTRLLAPLALGSGMPLVACLAEPGLALSVALWALAGFCSCYLIQVQAEFVGRIAPEIRGQGIALASGGLLGAQAIGLVGGGALTAAVPPSSCVAIAGVVAVACAGVLAGIRTRAD